jgi:hypothetical protein
MSGLSRALVLSVDDIASLTDSRFPAPGPALFKARWRPIGQRPSAAAR